MTRAKSDKQNSETQARGGAVDVHSVVSTEFERHLIVTAGAGTGKTSLLIERYVALLRHERASVEQIVAITFTEKAAAEIRMRLRDRLDAVLRESAEGERGRWAQAIEDLDKAPINTIHGFAAGLLREHPVEAGIDPGAVVEDEQQSIVRFERMWREWTAQELSGSDEAWREILRAHSLWAVRELALLLYRHREVVGDRALSVGGELEPIMLMVPGVRAAVEELRVALIGCQRTDEDPMGKRAPELMGLAKRFLELAEQIGAVGGVVDDGTDQVSPHDSNHDRAVWQGLAPAGAPPSSRRTPAAPSAGAPTTEASTQSPDVGVVTEGSTGRGPAPLRAAEASPPVPPATLREHQNVSHHDECVRQLLEWCVGLETQRKAVGKAWKGRWESEEAFIRGREAFDRLVVLMNDARDWAEHALLHRRTVAVIGKLEGFLDYCAQAKRSDGVLDFDDLLLRLRDVLRDRGDVRRRCQEQFRYLLVDEFQDTDPVQAEIVLYLAEQVTAAVHAARAEPTQASPHDSNHDRAVWQGLPPAGAILAAAPPTGPGVRPPPRPSSPYPDRPASLADRGVESEVTGDAAGGRGGPPAHATRRGDQDSVLSAKRQDVDWRGMMLAPGKLFIVGDPKQSIYGWRKADLAIYEQVVAMVGEQGARALTLDRNYRSDAQIVRFVNDSFRRLIVEEVPYQPPYLALEPERPSAGEAPRVELLLIDAPEGDGEDEESLSASQSRRIEATALAQRIERLVREGLPGGGETSYGKIAMLFRSLSDLGVYEEAMRAAGIPYLVLGGRGYYSRQEVTDLLNLLRVLDNAEDRLSLVGVLRSPIIGMDDRQILEAAGAGALRYDRPVPEGLACRAMLDVAYGLLRELAAVRHHRRVVELMEEIVARTSWLQVLASMSEGEQQVANIRKLIKTAARLDADGSLGLKRWIAVLSELVTSHDREGDSPLAEEGTNAVRIMTIHKAKGLEFDVVVVPDAQRGLSRNGRGAEVAVDRGNGRWGVNAAGFRTISWKMGLADMAQKQALAEERRLLYVALTRARECVMISGGLTMRKDESFLRWLGEAMEVEWKELAAGEWRRDEARVMVARVAEVETPVRARPMTVEQLLAVEPDAAAFEAMEAVAAARAEECARAFDVTRSRIAPVTALAKGASTVHSPQSTVKPCSDHGRRDELCDMRPATSDGSSPWVDAEIARRTGILVHETLQYLDFARPEGWERWLAARGEAEADLSPDDRRRLLEGSHRLVEQFLASPFAHRLRRATRLEREVPVLHREPSGVVADGRIDLMFEEDGTLYIVDYKTDRTIEEDLSGYTAQLTYYRHAVEAIMQRPVRTALYYIRHDRWIDV